MMSGRVPLGSGDNSNRMFIDLTEDSDKEISSQKSLVQAAAPFVTTLTHRSPLKTVPSKRKSLDRSEDSSDTSSDEPIKLGGSRRARLSHAHPTTPSPVESLKASQVSVVIPSPTSQQLRKFASATSIGPLSANGMSNNFFPTNEEEERVSRASYPSARQQYDIQRQKVPLSFNSGSALKLEARAAQKHLSLLRQTLKEKLDSIHGPPVTAAVNCPNLLAKLADNFMFINDYLFRAGVEPDSVEFNLGCSCTEGCDPTKCECLSLEEDSADLIVPYKISDTNRNLVVATQEFLHRKAIIPECTSLCRCQGERCWNHVVQNGRTVRLEIFDTGPRGFGLRSPDLIHAGQFIDYYLGEVITKADADAREVLVEGKNTQSYLFSLDWYMSDDGFEDKKMKVVDGRKFGSATRFINHSCNPNCKIVPVSTKNHADHYLYNIAFFAYRDIPPGTELTFDYNAGAENTTPQKIDPDAVLCLCGEANCRGQLWPNKRKGQGIKF